MADTKTPAKAKVTKSETKQTTHYKGIDLGTSRLIVAQMAGERPAYQEQLNAFVSLPYSKMLQSTLEQEGILHVVEDEEILAFGNRADEFANQLGGSMRRPMHLGLLNPDEPRNLQMMTLAIKQLCGRAIGEEKICFSVPCAPLGTEGNLTYHEESLRDVLEGLGYKASSINEGLAVVFAELQDSDFTGIGMSFGGGLCNVCVAFLGMPVLSFCTTRAGDYIDEQAAKAISETPTSVRLHKESEGFDLSAAAEGRMDQALSIFHRDVVKTAVSTLNEVLHETKLMPKLAKPVPVVFAGGTASVKGFQGLMKAAVEEARLPLPVSGVRHAKGGLNTTAKGSLLAAMLNM